MTPSIAPTRALVGHETSGAADAAAWCLTGLLFFCIACFVWGALVLRRRESGCSGNPEATGAERPVESGKPQPASMLVTNRPASGPLVTNIPTNHPHESEDLRLPQQLPTAESASCSTPDASTLSSIS